MNYKKPAATSNATSETIIHREPTANDMHYSLDNMIVKWLLAIILVTANAITVDFQQSKEALTLLRRALNVSGAHLTLELRDFDMEHIHLSNNSCGKCKKQFRNSSYLTYHWLSLHAGAHEEQHYAVHQLCLFAQCQDTRIDLGQSERAHLCNLFTNKYLQEMQGPISIEALRIRNRFCLSVLENPSKSSFAALWIALGWITLIAILIGMCFYYPHLIDYFASLKTRRKKKPE